MEKTVEIFDVASLAPVGQRSGDEVRYHCPFCLGKRGKPDDDAKLYWNVVKQTGFCFKCHTVIYPEGFNSVEASRQELERAAEQLAKMIDPVAELEQLPEPEEVGFPFWELGENDYGYLRQKRNPFLVPLTTYLGLKSWRGKDKGIVIPFIYRGKVVRFQVRFYERQNWGMGKYYTQPGAKPLYSPNMLLDTFQFVEGEEERAVTVCEGVFDAIALLIMRFPNPLALLGDELTPLHVKILRRLVPFHAYVCMDDWDRSVTIMKTLRRHIPSLQTIEISCEWGQTEDHKEDPESCLMTMLDVDPDFRKDCVARVQELLQG